MLVDLHLLQKTRLSACPWTEGWPGHPVTLPSQTVSSHSTLTLPVPLLHGDVLHVTATAVPRPHQEVDKFILTLNIPDDVSYGSSPDLKATVMSSNLVNMAILSGWAEGSKVLVTREVTHNTT